MLPRKFKQQNYVSCYVKTVVCFVSLSLNSWPCKFNLAARAREHKQRKLDDLFIHFFCLSPLTIGFTVKLNFNTSKVTYGDCKHFRAI